MLQFRRALFNCSNPLLRNVKQGIDDQDVFENLENGAVPDFGALSAAPVKVTPHQEAEKMFTTNHVAGVVATDPVQPPLRASTNTSLATPLLDATRSSSSELQVLATATGRYLVLGIGSLLTQYSRLRACWKASRVATRIPLQLQQPHNSFHATIARMFYSEELLSKTGPLARVWLASNVERKLSKSQILQSDIQSSVGAIVDQGQAPMALRLSGQLMLGVVRIYGRKARYLLDDCNETLLKIRMTFKNTTNNDLPAQQGVTLDLNLPDVLTVDDLFPSLDLSFPMTQTLNVEVDKSQGFNDDWTSSLGPQISTQARMSPDEAPLLEDDPGLELDLGDDIGFGNNTSMTIEAEVGRHAPAARPDNPDVFDDNDKSFLNDKLPLDIGNDVQMTDAPLNTEYDNPDNFFGQDDDGMAPPGDDTFQLANDVARRPRAANSPISDAPRDHDADFADETALEQTELAAQQQQRVRKRKVLLPDRETVLHNSQIKAQAEDRSKILRPVQQLPRDPYLLTLMQLQKSGDFVSNIMQDSRSKNWAPELQGLLSFDVVRSMAGAKRKRDSGIADLDSDEEGSAKSPRLELPEDEEEGFGAPYDEGVQMEQRDETVFELPADNAVAGEDNARNMMGEDDEDGNFMDNNDGAFDETTMPLLHPADAGPVSLGTKHAVHLLREKLGGGPNSSSPLGKRSVLLQDLVPEGATSREDATKMFFEVLVLATKDAVKVEQPGGDTKLGAPLRVRGKRGLWGAWAEMNEALDEAQGDVEVAV